jgi:hypothetical protein
VTLGGESCSFSREPGSDSSVVVTDYRFIEPVLAE